mgnify:CR=1 FL=1
MNIDFLILVTIYLAIILAIHYKLKTFNISPSIKPTILKDVADKIAIHSELDREIQSELETELETETDIESENIDSKLIIDTQELDNLSDTISNDFMKYLKVEENDNNEVYRKLSDSMDINLTENVKSLDSFFPEKKEKYTFDEVPTLNKNDGLLKKVKNLNSEKIFGQVYAFDDFNDNFALI